jgi:transcriptional regulator with XRE-family HTH domain
MEREEIAQRLGRNLFRLRRQAGLNQGDLGKQAGVSQPKVSQFEQDVALPPLEVFVGFCLALEARPDELLKGIKWR